MCDHIIARDCSQEYAGFTMASSLQSGSQECLLVCFRVHDHNDWLSMVVPGLRAPTALSPVTDAADSIGSMLGPSRQ